MTDTITIRPTPAADLERGDLIRHHGETRQILRVCDYGTEHVVIYSHDGSTTHRSDALLDVVVPSEPEPAPEAEPAWPTEPIIRILDGHRVQRDLGGAIALRTGARAYRLFLDGDEAGLVLRDEDDEAIEEWEALSVVPTEAVRALAARIDELDGADPRTSPGCRIVVRALRVAEAARSLVQVADTGEAED